MATIDYEQVDMNLLSIIMQLNNLQTFLMTPNISSLDGSKEFAFAIDDFRKKVALEIERQGQ